jgi:hypothetical protein
MIYVEKSFRDDKGDLYHQIRIHTSCCKRLYLVLEEKPGTYFDLEEGVHCLPGTAASIEQAIRLRKELT